MLTAGLTLARLIALFRTPLELYPDEAQYWLWSRTLAFGYYSKPPIIAWAIWASTAFGGDAEPWVRLPAVLFQAGATLAGLRRSAAGSTARRVGAGRRGALCPDAGDPALGHGGGHRRAAAVLHRPDALGLCGPAGRRRAGGGWLLAAGLGAALGLAFLSKYAAVYALIGIGLHLAVSPAARRGWTPAAAAPGGGRLPALVLAPNLAWNAAHGFATFQHTAADAHWARARPVQPGELGDFLGAQFAVFGPIPFAVLIVGAAPAGLAPAAGAGRRAAALLHPAADRHRRGAGLRQPRQRQLVGRELSAGRDPGGGLADPLAQRGDC